MAETQPLMAEYDGIEVPVDHQHHDPLHNSSDHNPFHHNAHYHIDVNPTIYSALVYAPAVSRIKNGKSLNKATKAVCCLIAMNTVLQLGLLYVMSIYAKRDAQKSVIFEVQKEHDNHELMNTYGKFLGSHEKEMALLESSTATGKDSLCVQYGNGTFTCMPPSVRFTSEWASLDTDGDGVWALSEAVGTKDNKALNATEEAIMQRRRIFFSSIIRSLKQRAEWMRTLNRTLYLTEDVMAARAIPKAYFDYWVGDAMICTRFDASACEHIVVSGLFDAALKHGRLAAAHKGISDYSTAADYCQMMLSGGGCEESLPPSSFQNAVSDRKSQCGKPTLNKAGVLMNPDDHADILPVVEPTYGRVQEEKLTTRPMFQFFLVLIIYLFYASLVDEARDLIKTTDFLLSFPGLKHAEDPGGEDMGKDVEKRFKIDRISSKHRAAITVVLLVRILITVMLISFGTYFLLKESSYMELVLNAVALSFITGIDEMMYEFFMESKEKKEIGFDDVERLKYIGKIPRDDGSCAGTSFRKDCWGIILIPVVTILLVLWNTYSFRTPVIAALNCACLQDGESCAESMANQGAWWEQYWTHTLPAAIHNIEALRLQGL